MGCSQWPTVSVWISFKRILLGFVSKTYFFFSCLLSLKCANRRVFRAFALSVKVACLHRKDNLVWTFEGKLKTFRVSVWELLLKLGGVWRSPQVCEGKLCFWHQICGLAIVRGLFLPPWTCANMYSFTAGVNFIIAICCKMWKMLKAYCKILGCKKRQHRRLILRHPCF